jgi:hypothetical protein
MGLKWRVLAPKSAKTARRAVTRPAKTARQLITPTPAKTAASRAFRATRPATGVRQEIEGRAVAAARERLHGRVLEQETSAKTMDFDVPASFTPGDILDGWTPEERPPADVPFLGRSAGFAALEAERLKVMCHTRGDPDTECLERLIVIGSVYELQDRILDEMLEALTTTVSARALDAEAARFLSWHAAWTNSAIEWWRSTEPQRDSISARLGSDVVDKLRIERAEPQIRQIVRRARDADGAALRANTVVRYITPGA